MSEYAAYKVGCNTVVVRDGKILLGKRKGGRQSDGFWGLPGGHLERGEKMEDCALRELYEETGLRASHAVFYNLTNDLRPEGGESTPEAVEHRIQVGFVVTDPEGVVELREPEYCYAWQWFAPHELPWEEIFSPFAKQLKSYLDQQVFVDGTNLL